jgi:hypothetical protein
MYLSSHVLDVEMSVEIIMESGVLLKLCFVIAGSKLPRVYHLYLSTFKICHCLWMLRCYNSSWSSWQGKCHMFSAFNESNNVFEHQWHLPSNRNVGNDILLCCCHIVILSGNVKFKDRESI